MLCQSTRATGRSTVLIGFACSDVESKILSVATESLQVSKDTKAKNVDMLAALRVLQSNDTNIASQLSQVAAVSGRIAREVDHVGADLRNRFDAVDNGVAVVHTQSQNISHSVQSLHVKMDDRNQVLDANFERVCELLGSLKSEIGQMAVEKAASYEMVRQESTYLQRILVEKLMSGVHLETYTEPVVGKGRF